ncbi:MAG: xanthine dehydrogenase family protein molybdopterin-binding subunit, partial [Chloroflexi bacterium]|nr:xanthine dehydrogenase family protein molybdopterin-binding subunit [Chloroflexota bacterium]
MAVETKTEAETAFGQALRRREDRKFITGEGNYIDDVVLPGMAYVAILRSPYGHARIRSIDTEQAKNAPGVKAVFTGQDLQAASVGAVPCGWILPDIKIPNHSALAVDKVRFQGDAVAAVAADSRSAAEDALELVEVDYEQLPAVVDPERAIEDGAPLLHDDIPNNITFRWSVSGGDVERAFREADRVIEQRLINQRLIPNAIECRGSVAHYQPGTG